MSGFVPKDETLSIRIPSETLNKLKKCASEKDMTVSFLLIMMIKDGLRKYQK